MTTNKDIEIVRNALREVPSNTKRIDSLASLDRIESALAEREWQPISTAPRDGTEVIFWLSSDKGFQDMTAAFYFCSGEWLWSNSEDVLKRPDFVKGWKPYPQPPKGEKE